jgi:hypothetical protein
MNDERCGRMHTGIFRVKSLNSYGENEKMARKFSQDNRLFGSDLKWINPSKQ